MFDSAAPDRSDLTLRFPADAYWHLVQTLRLALPPPCTDNTEDRSRRDRAAIAAVAALAPANAAEAELAAQFVAAAEQSKACLRLAERAEATPAWAAKCRAQAAAMMRQANSALRLLLRMQAVRRKIEADPAASDRLAWTEHCALRLMADALAAPPPADHPAPKPEPEQPEPAPAAGPAPAPVREPDFAAAERYAALYPERAAAIRRSGRLPCDVRYFDPPEATLLRALVGGRTPALLALDASPAARTT